MANKFMRALSSSDDGHHQWRRPIHKGNACIVRNGELISTTLKSKKQNVEENETRQRDGRKSLSLPTWFRFKRQIRAICVEARALFRLLLIYTMENRCLVARNLCVVMAWLFTVYSVPIEFAAAFVSVSLILFIFMNLGGKRKKGELSAYSVFNKGFHQLPGTLDARDIDAQLRHESSPSQAATSVQDNMQRVSNSHHARMLERAKTLGRKTNVQIRHVSDGRVLQMKWRHAQARVDSGVWELHHVPKVKRRAHSFEPIDSSGSDEDN